MKLDRPVYVEAHPVDENHKVVDQPRVTDPTADILRVNHYYTKSDREYREKWSTPRADTGELRTPLRRDQLETLSEVEDEAIQIYLPALRAAVS